MSILYLTLVFIFNSPPSVEVYRRSEIIFCDVQLRHVLTPEWLERLNTGTRASFVIKTVLEDDEGKRIQGFSDTVVVRFDPLNGILEWSHGSIRQSLEPTSPLDSLSIPVSDVPVQHFARLKPDRRYRLSVGVNVAEHGGGSKNPISYLTSGLHGVVKFFFGWLAPENSPTWMRSDYFVPNRLTER